MKRLLYILILLCLAGCSRDAVDSALPVQDGEPVELLIKFGSQNIEHNIVTRQTMPEISDEAKITSFYLYSDSIDEIDDYIAPLYGLSQEELEFIKNYEIEFRLTDDD